MGVSERGTVEHRRDNVFKGLQTDRRTVEATVEATVDLMISMGYEEPSRSVEAPSRPAEVAIDAVAVMDVWICVTPWFRNPPASRGGFGRSSGCRSMADRMG